MNELEKLQKEIDLLKELLALKEKLLEVEKQFGIKRIEYVPIYPQYPYNPPYWITSTTGGGCNNTVLTGEEIITYTSN